MKKSIFKVITGVVLSSTLLFSTQMEASAQTFKDVPTNHAAYKSIESIHKKGIISGYGDGKFGPNNTLTRSQMAKILGESLDLKEPKTKTPVFKDVKAKDYYTPYLNPLVSLGAFQSGTKFDPFGTLTNSQLMKLLSVGYGVTETNSSIKLPNSVKNHWSKDHYNALVNSGVLTLAEINNLQPNAPAKRSTVAIYVDRLINSTTSEVAPTALTNSNVQTFSVDSNELHSMIKDVGKSKALSVYAGVVAEDLKGYTQLESLNFVYNHLYTEGPAMIKILGLNEKTGYATISKAILDKAGLSTSVVTGKTHSWNKVVLSNKDVVILDILVDRTLKEPYQTLGSTTKAHKSYASITPSYTGVATTANVNAIKNSTKKAIAAFE